MGVQEDAEDVGRATADPMLVQQYHLRLEDDQIRGADMPERLYERMKEKEIPRFRTEHAATYIYKSLFGQEVNPLAKVRTTIQE